MFRWLVNTYMKNHIDELVDQRLKERMFERYYEHKGQELRQRIAKVRKDLHSQAQGVQEDKPTEVLSSSDIRRSESKPSVLPKTSQADLDRANEMNALRAKLTGKKK